MKLFSEMKYYGWPSLSETIEEESCLSIEEASNLKISG